MDMKWTDQHFIAIPSGKEAGLRIFLLHFLFSDFQKKKNHTLELSIFYINEDSVPYQSEGGGRLSR